MRTRTGCLTLCRRLGARGRGLEDRAATCATNRRRTRRFLVLRCGRTAARRAHLTVEAAQVLRSSPKHDRWQEHHHREGGQDEAAHGRATVCCASAFRKPGTSVRRSGAAVGCRGEVCAHGHRGSTRVLDARIETIYRYIVSLSTTSCLERLRVRSARGRLPACPHRGKWPRVESRGAQARASRDAHDEPTGADGRGRAAAYRVSLIRVAYRQS